MRFQWVMEVMRGQSTHMELSLEGLATSVMGGLQDELFNLTLDNLQVSLPCLTCHIFHLTYVMSQTFLCVLWLLHEHHAWLTQWQLKKNQHSSTTI